MFFIDGLALFSCTLAEDLHARAIGRAVGSLIGRGGRQETASLIHQHGQVVEEQHRGHRQAGQHRIAENQPRSESIQRVMLGFFKSIEKQDAGTKTVLQAYLASAIV